MTGKEHSIEEGVGQSAVVLSRKEHYLHPGLRWLPHSFALLLCVGGGLGFRALAHSREDVASLFHTVDWSGTTCGVDPEVALKPYLYWCTKGGRALVMQQVIDAGINPAVEVNGAQKALPESKVVHAAGRELDLSHPVCVGTCPWNGNTVSACFHEGSAQIVVQDYPTTLLAGKYCMPQNSHHSRQLEGMFTWGQSVILLQGHWRGSVCCFLAAAALASALCVALLGLAQRAPISVMCTGSALSLVLLVCLSVAALLLRDHSSLEAVGKGLEEAGWANSSSVLGVQPIGSQGAEFGIWLLLATLGVLMSASSLPTRKNILLAPGSLQVAFECISDAPILLLQPFCLAVPLILYLSAALALAWIQILHAERLEHLEHLPEGAVPWTQHAISGFAALWGLEFLLDTNAFVVGYVAASSRSHSRGYLERFATSAWTLGQGCSVALYKQVGSLALGAFLCSMVRIVRLPASFLHICAELAVPDGAEGSSTVVRCCAACCSCFAQDLLPDCAGLHHVHRHVYLVMAQNSVGFFDAVKDCSELRRGKPLATGTLEGTSGVFHFSSLVFVMLVSSYLTWLCSWHLDMFSNSTSRLFIANPVTVATFAGLVSLVVAACFAVLLDLLSDAAIFSRVAGQTQPECSQQKEHSQDIPGFLSELD